MSINTDLHIVKVEYFDPDMMVDISNDKISFSKSIRKRLSEYRDKRLHGNKVEVVYHFAKGCEVLQLGRLYVKNNIGLQNFPQDIRNSLINKFYFDIDMENCHYNIMAHLGKKWNINVDNIKYYCKNRNKCLEKLSNDRNISKIAYLKIAYGGNIKEFNPYLPDDLSQPNGDLSQLKEVERETKLLVEKCFQKYQDFHEIVKDKKNPKTSLFSLILQTEERKCLLALDEFFKNNGRSPDILIHDGIEVRKLENEKVFPEELLRLGEIYIKEKTGYTMKLVCKPFNKLYKFTKEPKIKITDDYACKVFVKLMDKNICKDNNLVYYFDDRTGLWSYKDENFIYYATKFQEELTFLTNNDKEIYYGANYKNLNNMRKFLEANLNNSNYISNNIDTSIGKLLFDNGIYDFETKNFIKGFDYKIIFLNKIYRNYENVNNNLINEVNHILFEMPFENVDKKCCNNHYCNSGDYLKKVLTMSLFGDYKRKKCYFGTGRTNSGKGLLCQAFRNAFDGFVDEFNANNLCFNNNSCDEAKKLAWIKDFYGKRLVFSNEIRIDSKGFDGNLIKTIVSGGDKLKIRGNFEDQNDFINKSTLFMLSNDIPTISPCDDAVVLRCKCFKYNVSFVEKPREFFEKQADSNVKNKFCLNEYKNALVQLIINTYNELSNNEKSLGGYIEEPKCVLLESKNRVVSEKETFMNFILEKYEITNKDGDFVPCGDIIHYINNICEMNLSFKLIGNFLNEILLLPTKNVNHIKCRNGIKEKSHDN
jgi:hypothetical protein